MSARRHPAQALYEPKVGELVRDERSGRNGEYQCKGFGEYPTVLLRPKGGGCEWEAPASEIRKVALADEVKPVAESRPPGRPQGSERP
ncbi:hypothetical protein [Kitasatospora sp. NPDC088346]|uniref:hypothetical protein n=1 Tax=Kitasatospora sp. NPDC088346 TaxID=3364073 RepID=UPI003808E79E